MRLGQLARKLAVRPTEIAEFLSKENIQQEAGSNTRLDDDQVIYLVKRFAPTMVDTIKAELTKEEEVEEIIVAAPTPVVAEPIVESTPIAEAVTLQEVEIPTPVTSKEIIEVVAAEKENKILTEEDIIRAPKVELPGLKVLGKIEIPEPKKKEVQPLAEEAPVDENAVLKEETVAPKKEVAPVRERRQYQDKRREFNRQDDRQRRNPIAIQREREEEEARQKREEATKLEKERRTLHYMKKVKVVTPVKINTFIDEPSERKIVKQEAPTSLWGRFKSWLKS